MVFWLDELSHIVGSHCFECHLIKRLGQLVLAFPGEELPSLVAISFLEIAGHGRSWANSVIISDVSRGVSECGW